MNRPSRRQLLFATLYFCEGAPIGLLWWALPAYWAGQGVSAASVTLITAVSVLPWSVKWAWAPLVDLTSPRWSYRQWIISAQVVMGLSLVPLVWLDPHHAFYGLLGLLVVHAFSAATQDVAIDGMCVATVEEHERGKINGWMQAGMLLGRALFGGGALVLAAQTTLTFAVAALIAILWSVALWLAFFRPSTAADPGPQPISDRGAAETTASEARSRTPGRWSFLKLRRVWLAVAFALVGGATYESTGALLGPYLDHSGLSLSNVGLFQLGPLAASMAIGALFGGSIADRFGHVRVAWFSLLSLVVLNTVLGIVAGRVSGSLALIAVEYALIGIFTASSYALFMDISSAGLKATLFSAFMGATNACESASAFAAGRLVSGFSVGSLPPVPALGYSGAFIMMTVPSLLGLAILPLLRKRA